MTQKLAKVAATVQGITESHAILYGRLLVAFEAYAKRSLVIMIIDTIDSAINRKGLLGFQIAVPFAAEANSTLIKAPLRIDY